MHWDILENRHTYYDVIGGRGSLKSSAISIEIILGIISDPLANAMIFRKVADTIGDSVYAQIVWAIEKLGLTSEFKCTVSPFRCTYIKTGQKIIFKGLDKAGKTKSAKVSIGYFKYMWFEEVDQFAGQEELRSVQQSVLRGGDSFKVFRSMNPPKSNIHWANRAVEENRFRDDVYISKTTYLSAPPQWLGKQFIQDAEYLKETNPTAYAHEYLGEVVGTGTEVFDNITAQNLRDEEIKSFANIYMGVDWGWYPDPFQWVKCCYNAAQRELIVFDEYRAFKTRNSDTWEYLRTKKLVKEDDLITADSAEQKSVGDFRSYGSNTRAAVKGPGSVEAGIKWLQSLNRIIIDPKRCPNVYKEFNEYEYELTRTGEVMSGYPDFNNHSIDATRYALERVWKRKGN